MHLKWATHRRRLAQSRERNARRRKKQAKKPQPPGETVMPKHSTLAAILDKLVAAIAVTATVLLLPLLAFSETTIKGILDRWLTQCIIVVDSHNGDKGAIVRLYTFGEMPPALPITIVADTGEVDRITFMNHVEQRTAGNESNLLVHPQANQRCPGVLCEEQTGPAERLTLRITPMDPHYVYQLRVLTSDVLDHRNIKTYVRPLKDDNIECRVERATAANFFARQRREIQLLILSLGVLAITFLITLLRRHPKGSPQ